MNLRRGDVVLIQFPNSDLLTYKLRPALVVQDLNIGTGIAQVVLALITSNLRRTGPTRVQVTGSTQRAMGVLAPSVIVTDVLQTVREAVIGRTIGTCPVMDQVGRALRATLGL